MPQDKWVKRWGARSSSGGGDWIVGQDENGEYGCSCPGWTMQMFCPACELRVKKAMTFCPHCYCDLTKNKSVRHDCYHIKEVKEGRGRPLDVAVMDKLVGR